MNSLIISIMKNRLVEKIILNTSKTDNENIPDEKQILKKLKEEPLKQFKNIKIIEVLKRDCLPDLKDINPTKEDIDYFFANIVTIDQHQREFDCLIGKL